MSDRWEDLDAPRRHRRPKHERRRRRREVAVEVEEELAESLLTPEERALREADRKVKLTGDLIKFGIIAALLLIFLPPIGIIFLIFSGAKHFRKFYALVLEPRMRERYLREEVAKQVHAQLSEERQLMEGEHARSMQELSASIAHEIRNPITAAKSLVQQMEEDPGAVQNVEYAHVALEELSRVERSVSHLLRFARDEEMRVSTVRMADVVDSALETFRDRLERSGIALERRIEADGEVVGDPEKLRRVVINLIGNAIDAIDESHTENGRIEVQMGENLAGSQVWLRIADNGPGVDELALRKMFSPFYTSKEGGTGLGLPICKKLIDAHGGTIEVDPAKDGGAAFVVTLPRAGGGDAS